MVLSVIHSNCSLHGLREGKKMLSNLDIVKYMDNGTAVSFKSIVEICSLLTKILLLRDFAVKMGSLISMCMMRSLGVKTK